MHNYIVWKSRVSRNDNVLSKHYCGTHFLLSRNRVPHWMRHARHDVRVKIGTTNICMIHVYVVVISRETGSCTQVTNLLFHWIKNTRKKLYSNIKSVIHEKMCKDFVWIFKDTFFFLLFNYNFLNLRWEWCRSLRQKTSHNPPWAILSPWISTKYILQYSLWKKEWWIVFRNPWKISYFS